MQPRFSIAPAAKSGSASMSTLVGRVGDAVVVLVPAQRGAPISRAERREVALAGHVDDAQRHTVDVDRLGGLERADDEGDEVRAHLHRRLEGDDVLPSRARAVDLGAVGHCEQSGSTTRVISNTALNSGSSKQGNARRQSVACIWVVAMTLLVAVRVLERAAIPAAQLVVERAGEHDVDGGVAVSSEASMTSVRSSSSRRNVAAAPPTGTEAMSSSSAFRTTDRPSRTR